MWSGIGFALAAGMLWGLVFVCPLLLDDYPALMLAFARHVAFGAIALPLAWHNRAALAGLRRADWLEALGLALVGNLLYYGLLAGAIQRSGAPLPSVIIGTLPVVLPVVANLFNHRADGRVTWRSLAPSLALMCAGLLCVNQGELEHLAHESRAGLLRHGAGALLTLGALACWIWYAIRNTRWLRANPRFPPQAWATAYGLCTLPAALACFAGLWISDAAAGGALQMPLGPRPLLFAALMLGMALLPSWLGNACWNLASQRLPTALMGQLTIFEALSGLGYAFMLRGIWPPALTLAGVGLLLAGVLAGTRIRFVAPGPACAGRGNAPRRA
ncbi:MAG: DMT family transporter [Candidatus Dactylopiibacterium sp.]|nr:DMT family transporter [Candidatus Dactylopiibacterium sp.]